MGISLITAKPDWKFARAWLAVHFKSKVPERLRAGELGQSLTNEWPAIPDRAGLQAKLSRINR